MPLFEVRIASTFYLSVDVEAEDADVAEAEAQRLAGKCGIMQHNEIGHMEVDDHEVEIIDSWEVDDG